MFLLGKLMKYPMKKRKRSVLSAMFCATLIYVGVQFVFVSNEYSPLQLMSSVENEASRLLRFMTQQQITCNSTISTNNASMWLLCLDSHIGLASWNLNGNPTGVTYSIGPTPDFNFEWVVGRNLSQRLFIFSALQSHRDLLSISNTTSVIEVSIVPNDPADFGRNSYDSQTLNSIKTTLKHKHIDVLKLDMMIDGVQTHEVLRFLTMDSFLHGIKELHVVIKLDKVEEDYIYSWYRVLYLLFHTAGFRLYHTATSDPLCLQDTIMESCVYFLSFVQKPPAHIFVMYPPAIDGSLEYEEDRMLDFLHQSDTRTVTLVPYRLKLTRALSQPHSLLIVSQLMQRMVEKNTQILCHIIFILPDKARHFQYFTDQMITSMHCKVSVYAELPSSGQNLQNFVKLRTVSRFAKADPKKQTTVSFTDLIQVLQSYEVLHLESKDTWQLLSTILEHRIHQSLNELRIKVPIFHSVGRAVIPTSSALRRKYSMLKQVEEFGLTLVSQSKFESKSLKYVRNMDLYTLHFVRKSFL